MSGEGDNADSMIAPAAAPSSSMSRLECELHPLQNYQILSTVFSFCSVTDLKNCRLVGSKLWLKASLNSWREKAVLNIKSQDLLNSSVPYPGILFADFQRIHTEEEDVFQFQRKPFQKILLRRFAPKNGEVCPGLSWILENYSAHLKHVTLADSDFWTKKAFMDIIFLQLPSLVELKVLGRRVGVGDYRWGNTNYFDDYPKHQNLKSLILVNGPVFLPIPMWSPWQSIFEKTPNLEELRIQSAHASVTEEAREILRAIHVHQLNIKNLDITFIDLAGMGGTYVDLGSVMPVHMNEVGIGAGTLPLERFTGTIADLVHLKPFSKTLKFISVFIMKDVDYPESEPQSSSVPDMKDYNVNDISDEKISFPILKELHVKGTPSRIFKNLNKVEAYNLETLFIDGKPCTLFALSDSNSCEMIKLYNLSFGNVTKLVCYSDEFCAIHKFKVDEFRQLSVCMPNMLHVKMALGGDLFTELCRMWPMLRTLNILNPHLPFSPMIKVGDEAITGFPPDADPASGRLPNITNLKYLTDFECHYELTDHSVIFGFLQLPRLYSLKVKFEQISEEAKTALQMKVHILEIYNQIV